LPRQKPSIKARKYLAARKIAGPTKDNQVKSINWYDAGNHREPRFWSNLLALKPFIGAENQSPALRVLTAIIHQVRFFIVGGLFFWIGWNSCTDGSCVRL
jgi:hypothetical protein